MPAKPTKTCTRCGKWLTGHGRRTTTLCLNCWREVRRENKTRYFCRDCGNPCSEMAARGLGRCNPCSRVVRAARVTKCLDCGVRTTQKSDRCRPCWHTHLSKIGMTPRMAQGRATALKRKVRISRLEQQLMQLLELAGEPYEHSVPVERWIVDFCLPQRRTMIEVHGSYWHDRPSAVERDERKRLRLQELGWTVLFLRGERNHLWLHLLQEHLGLSFPLPVAAVPAGMGKEVLPQKTRRPNFENVSCSRPRRMGVT